MDEVQHRHAQLSELKVFYREAGDPRKPTMLLLHGFPTSSHMFRRLIPLLAPEMHVVAPDLPGFGYTESPPASTFEYTFDHLADTVEELLQHLHITRFFVYIMDYGAPTGLRLVEAHPERILGLVVQNGNAYEEGLTAFWEPLRKLWKDRTPETEAPLRAFLSLEGTRSQYVDGVKDVGKVSPDNWVNDMFFLQQPGHDQIQLDLFYDYRHNLLRYPGFQATFRKHQFPTLIVWGKNDGIFGVAGATAFLRDLPHAELVLLDGGHFVLEDHLTEVANHIVRFVTAATATENK